MRSVREIEDKLRPLLAEYLIAVQAKGLNFQGCLFELSWPIEHQPANFDDHETEEGLSYKEKIKEDKKYSKREVTF